MHRSSCVRSAVVGLLKNGVPRMSPETTDGERKLTPSRSQSKRRCLVDQVEPFGWYHARSPCDAIRPF